MFLSIRYRFKLTVKCLDSLAYDLSYCVALALQVLQIGKLARSCLLYCLSVSAYDNERIYLY